MPQPILNNKLKKKDPNVMDSNIGIQIISLKLIIKRSFKKFYQIKSNVTVITFPHDLNNFLKK